MAKKERKIPEVLVWSDINNYADDLASMVILAYLADQKLINLRGVIAELGNYDVRRRRAMYAKGVMAHLGYPFLRAVPGGDYDLQDEPQENHYIENEFTSVFEAAGVTVQRSGTLFLQEYMKSVKDKNIVVLLNAPFEDFGKYLKATHDTVLKKVKKVVVMGNVLKAKDENGFYQPDLESFNFKRCPEAAKELFDYVQKKGIRTTVVPASAVKGFKPDYAFLDVVQKSKNPVVKALMRLKDEDNPSSMVYDMISALCLTDGVFKAGGGVIEKNDETESISFARIENPQMMRDKISEIFKAKLEVKTISMDHLKSPKSQSANEDGTNA